MMYRLHALKLEVEELSHWIERIIYKRDIGSPTIMLEVVASYGLLTILDDC
jgi:hypothetical protein